jgi:hypothetical protein
VAWCDTTQIHAYQAQGIFRSGEGNLARTNLLLDPFIDVQAGRRQDDTVYQLLFLGFGRYQDAVCGNVHCVTEMLGEYSCFRIGWAQGTVDTLGPYQQETFGYL